MRIATCLCLGLTALLVTAATSQAAITVTPGGATFTSTINPSVRYKGFNNSSGANTGTYLGQSDLGNGANRNSQTGNGYYSASNDFTFTFDGIDKVTSVIGGKTLLSRTLSGDPGLLNAIQLRVRNTLAGTVTLSNLTINGDSTFAPATSFTATGVQNYWTLSGFDLTSGFTITGTIGLSGAMASSESAQVELNAGYNAAYAAVPEPGSLVTWGGIVAIVGLVGMRSRRRAATT